MLNQEVTRRDPLTAGVPGRGGEREPGVEGDFCVDIATLKVMGVREWQENFYWPVSDEEFKALSCDVDAFFLQLINMETNEISDVLLVSQFLLALEFAHFFHALQVIGRVEQRGQKIRCAPATLWYAGLLGLAQLSPSMLKVMKTSWERPAPLRRILGSWVKRPAENIMRNFGVSRPLYSLRNSLSGVLYGWPDALVKSYIKTLPYCVNRASLAGLIPPRGYRYRMAPDLKSALAGLAGTIAQGLQDIARRNDVSVQAPRMDYLRQFTQDTLMETARSLAYIRGRLGGGRKHIIVSGLGHLSYRALCVAARRMGWKVTMFSHGGATGLYDTPLYAFSEFALADEFVGYASSNIPHFEAIRDNHGIPRDHRVTMTSPDCDEYLRIWNRVGRKNPYPRKIETVMVIGYPHNQLRKRPMAAGLSLMQLDFELRIVNALKAAGYRVLYKAHPDRALEVQGLFENTVTGYLEKCHAQADALVFGSIRTTAFPFALSINKPIVAFRMSREPYPPFPEAFSLLEKRCGIVQAGFDERNRILFDGKELTNALERCILRSDTAYLEKYLFPSQERIPRRSAPREKHDPSCRKTGGAMSRRGKT